MDSDEEEGELEILWTCPRCWTDYFLPMEDYVIMDKGGKEECRYCWGDRRDREVLRKLHRGHPVREG